ncbi:glycosyltransferase family 2 protein [Gilvimarinus sp. F26214L]|uniref:glycosyltransferase family 2 protein n=1 Tax=Gilvimarinus sp. DZF01 TaxID=3461371 RepID=UPI004046783B
MERQAKVSIIVPVFNAGEKLVPSIESLVSQTLQDLEIILVNDASTDHSGTVIDQLAQEKSNIVPVHLPENKGVHEARLAGLKMSTAPWIGFLDADDFARPTMFATLYSAAVENDVDIVVCGSDRVTEERRVVAPKLRFRRSEKVERRVLERFCEFEFGTGMLWNKLFKRAIIEPWFDLHFPWRQSINEDLLLNIGCFHRAKSVFLLRDTLHEYVLSSSSVTNTMEKGWAYVEIFRAYALAITFYQHLGTHVLASIIEMYRTQLGWECYQLPNADDLTKYRDKLEEATCLLFQKDPFVLSAISARQRPAVGAKLALRSLYTAMSITVKRTFRKGIG